jgi:hypothetical protein
MSDDLPKIRRLYTDEEAPLGRRLYTDEEAPLGPSRRPIPTDPDAVLTEAETSLLSSLSVRTLQTYRLQGGGPPFVKLGNRRVGYRRGSLNKWLIDRERSSTSDSGPEAA